MNILICDDDDGVRDMAREILQDQGYTVECVRNGQEAIGRIINAPETYRVLLLDWYMPVMDGAAVIEWLNTSPAWRTSVIVMTASPDELRVPHAILRKPFDINRLLSMLEIEAAVA